MKKKTKSLERQAVDTQFDIMKMMYVLIYVGFSQLTNRPKGPRRLREKLKERSLSSQVAKKGTRRRKCSSSQSATVHSTTKREKRRRRRGRGRREQQLVGSELYNRRSMVYCVTRYGS
jgi:PAB1-binding protein PBP1